MTTRVYSPAGEPFDIPRRDLADKLILEEGWTQSAPVAEAPVEKEEAPKPSKRSRRKAKAVEVDFEPADADEKEDEQEPTEE